MNHVGWTDLSEEDLGSRAVYNEGMIIEKGGGLSTGLWAIQGSNFGLV